MTGALIILAVTALIGVLLWLHDRSRRSDSASADSEPPRPKPDKNDECCGMHAVCEKQLLTPVSPEIEYFDDEELDLFRGREPQSYTEGEIEQFREILLTMQPGEVASWSRSLQLRGITPPNPIRDEVLLIVGEQRAL